MLFQPASRRRTLGKAAVIVGMTLFYATLSVVSMILGDVMMTVVDPRISFTSKGR